MTTPDSLRPLGAPPAPDFTPKGTAGTATCRECGDSLEWGATPTERVAYRCTTPDCERVHLIVDENDNTPEEAENWEPHVPHWTDAWPKGTPIRDIFAEND